MKHVLSALALLVATPAVASTPYTPQPLFMGGLNAASSVPVPLVAYNDHLVQFEPATPAGFTRRALALVYTSNYGTTTAYNPVLCTFTTSTRPTFQGGVGSGAGAWSIGANFGATFTMTTSATGGMWQGPIYCLSAAGPASFTGTVVYAPVTP